MNERPRHYLGANDLTLSEGAALVLPKLSNF